MWLKRISAEGLHTAVWELIAWLDPPPSALPVALRTGQVKPNECREQSNKHFYLDSFHFRHWGFVWASHHRLRFPVGCFLCYSPFSLSLSIWDLISSTRECGTQGSPFHFPVEKKEAQQAAESSRLKTQGGWQLIFLFLPNIVFILSFFTLFFVLPSLARSPPSSQASKFSRPLRRKKESLVVICNSNYKGKKNN